MAISTGSISQTFPVTLDSFDKFVTAAQKHIQHLQSTSQNCLGKLVITFFLERVLPPKNTTYLIERPWGYELKTAQKRHEQSGTRCIWPIDKDTKPETYEFRDERKRIADFAMEALSYEAKCTILGCDLSGKFIYI